MMTGHALTILGILLNILEKQLTDNSETPGV